MKTTFFMTWENHASEVAQCMCHYHRHFEEIGRGGKSTLPKPLRMHRHPKDIHILGPRIHSPGKNMAMVLHTSTRLQPPEDPCKTPRRNIGLAHSLPGQAMGTAKSVVRMPT